MYQPERALFDLRAGRPILVRCGGRDEGADRPQQGDVVAVAVEGLGPRTWDRLGLWGDERLRVVLTRHRAHALGVNGSAPSGSDVSGELPPASSPRDALVLASVVGEDADGVRGWRRASPAEAGALALARLGRLLPSVVTVEVGPTHRAEVAEAVRTGEVLAVQSEDIERFRLGGDRSVALVSRAPVPLPEVDGAHFALFRDATGLEEHLAILIGEPTGWPDPLPVRLHSACLTGDIFGSLRCDCGEQLRGSLSHFQARGGGVLLYLAQEGRGIGLGNKLRAYSIQEQGLDTIDADCALGFDADERDYAVAVQMLAALEVGRVELLTNNPEKIRALRAGGVRVVDRVPLHGTLNRHNLPYVRAKVHRAGHWLGDMLYGGGAGS